MQYDRQELEQYNQAYSRYEQSRRWIPRYDFEVDVLQWHSHHPDACTVRVALGERVDALIESAIKEGKGESSEAFALNDEAQWWRANGFDTVSLKRPRTFGLVYRNDSDMSASSSTFITERKRSRHNFMAGILTQMGKLYPIAVDVENPESRSAFERICTMSRDSGLLEAAAMHGLLRLNAWCRDGWPLAAVSPESCGIHKGAG
ncbi:hypothetical protein OG215_40575 (plasmid) [Streptomyces globisporus]|uniref:hypothetical protein n=1 Tax=Streptomyces globisporus TaxID=1908 RepID=UPI002F90A5C5|nr:hypothetical protein OG215_40575 [Streptomyces globisporus]